MKDGGCEDETEGKGAHRQTLAKLNVLTLQVTEKSGRTERHPERYECLAAYPDRLSRTDYQVNGTDVSRDVEGQRAERTDVFPKKFPRSI